MISTHTELPSQVPTSSPPITPPPRRRFSGRVLVILLLVILAGFSLVGLGLMLSSASGSGMSMATAGSTGEVTVTSDVTAGTSAAGQTSGSVSVADSVALVDVSDVVSDVVDSVVTVQVIGTFRGMEAIVGTASGVIVDSDGTIVTNAHVVDEASSLNVILTDGSEHEATIVFVDTDSDVALVDIDAADLSPIQLGATDGLEVGDPVIAIGNPLGLEGGPSVSTGIVSALGRVLEESDVSLDGVIQTDAAITEGSSGGALLDAQGHLIGITTAIGVSSVGVEGIGFAIPVETVASVMATAGAD